MHTLKLEINDTIFDKVMFFLNNLPKNKVAIIEEESVSTKVDFIEYLSSNPVKVNNEFKFLSRSEANER
jgi:hypothetical protein